MATEDTPILKLNNGNNDYYPLTVASAVALSEPIVVKSAIGGFKAGEVISVATTIFEILSKLFSFDTKKLKYDKVTIRTNRQGEMYVNRDALIKFDNQTIKEDGDHTISVDIKSLIDNDILVVSDDGKITINLSNLVDSNSLRVNTDKKLSVNTDSIILVDNNTIKKDSEGRLALNKKCIEVKGTYLYKDEDDKICFNESLVNNFDPSFIILNSHQKYTINTNNVVTTHDDNQIVSGFKIFDTISVKNIFFDCNSNNSIEVTEDGIVIDGIVDIDSEKSPVTKKHLSDKLNDSSVFSSIAVFKALNMKSCYGVQCNSDIIEHGTKNIYNQIKYSVDIPAGHIEVLKLRSSVSKNDMNVIVDWGDGTVTDIKSSPTVSRDTIGVKEGVFFEFSNIDNEKNYYLTHIYPDLNELYTVSVYGNTYWGMHHSKEYPNLLNRLFANDLPICNCVKSLTDMAAGSLRLLEVNLPSYFDVSSVSNFSGCFKECLNLWNVRGFKKHPFVNSTAYSCSLFEGCSNLKYCDVHISGNSENYRKSNSGFYKGCTSLISDIIDLIPSGGFSKRIVSMKEVFKDCKNLVCDDWDYVSDILWNDSTKIWKDTESCFIGCSDEFRKHIPESWGGLKKIIFDNDVIVIRNMDEIYNLVNDIVKKLELDLSIMDDSDLYNAINSIAKLYNIKIRLTKDSQLANALNSIVVSLGAKQLITLF